MSQERIVCQRCRHPNPAGSLFCGDCGARLDVLSCGVCQAANPPGTKFCHECGAALAPEDAPASGRFRSYTPRHLVEEILTSRGAIEGERKQVTVLFVDVAGFTHLAERLDLRMARGRREPPIHHGVLGVARPPSTAPPVAARRRGPSRSVQPRPCHHETVRPPRGPG